MPSRLFKIDKPLIGMVHCKAFPGSPAYVKDSWKDVIQNTIKEANVLIEGGVDAILLENAGDVPFIRQEELGPETAALMAILVNKIRSRTELPLGVNIVANAAKVSLAAAVAGGADFIRVNQWVNAYISNEGLTNGMAGSVIRYRKLIDGENIAVLADVHVKHGSHAIVSDRSISEQAVDAEFYCADALVASGSRTGDPTNLEELNEIRNASKLPVFIGSGLTIENAEILIPNSDGAIVGFGLKNIPTWDSDVDIKKVKQIKQIFNKYRK
jgi:membrane complex biogenesis BtpA family protein